MRSRIMVVVVVMGDCLDGAVDEGEDEDEDEGDDEVEIGLSWCE